jgi:hypothetical protein
MRTVKEKEKRISRRKMNILSEIKAWLFLPELREKEYYCETPDRNT